MIDWSLMQDAAARAAERAAIRRAALSDDCRARIDAVLPPHLREGLATALLAGRLPEADRALHAAGADWMLAMRRALEVQLADPASGPDWPAPPEALAGLVARF